MTQAPQPPAYQQPEQPGGVQGALTRQIGPLKTWQWGLAIGGAVLLYKMIKGGGETTTTASVPFTSVGDGLNANNGSNVSVVKIPTIEKTILYYKAVLTKRTAIFDKTGKRIGWFKEGRTIILGKKIKIKGKWYYPILNMPGKFLRASQIDEQPIYNEQISSDSTVQAISNAIAAPMTTVESSRALVEPYPGNAVYAQPSAPSISTGVIRSRSITAPSYTRA